jgi:hypothetical protein
MPVFPGQSTAEWERIGDTLELATYIMFVFGTIFGVVAGTIGGWIRLALYRTGESRVDVTSTVRPLS